MKRTARKYPPANRLENRLIVVAGVAILALMFTALAIYLIAAVSGRIELNF